MALQFRFPDVGEGIHEGKLVKWLVKEGDEVKADQAIVEVETDKAVVEIPAPKAGFILKVYFKEGEVITVGQVMVVIGEKGEPVPALEEQKPAGAPKMPMMPGFKPPASSMPAPPVSAPAAGQVFATPSVRMRARELNVDLAKVKGSGPGGRIMPEDVEAAAKGGVSSVGVQQTPTTTTEKFEHHAYGPEERIPLTNIRRRIAEQMSKSERIIPHVAHLDEADVTELAFVREQEKRMAENAGVKLTYLSYIVKAVVAALKAHPYVNASFDHERNEIIVKKYYNVGIAVDTPEGLIVPVLWKADEKKLYDIAREIVRLGEEARARKLRLEDVRGGTFTITNIGSIGGEYFTPIINYPECAILGVGRMRDKPVVKNGQVTIRKMLALSLSFDHRIIDGAEAARFMNDIIKMLENPKMLAD